MNRATNLEQRYRNGEHLDLFYQDVLQHFIHTLEKEYRYKPFVTEGEIDLIEVHVKKRLQFTKDHSVNENKFEKYLTMKECGRKYQPVEVYKSDLE